MAAKKKIARAKHQKHPAHERSVPMPSLIFQEIPLSDTERGNSWQPSPTEQLHEQKIRRWMWLGASIVSVIIIALWSWSFKVQITTFNWNSAGEKKLATDAVKNWQGTVQPAVTSPNKELALQEIQRVLSAALANSTTPPNEASTTTTVITTSNIETTTTSLLLKPKKQSEMKR